jgi:hypothetical protein
MGSTADTTTLYSLKKHPNGRRPGTNNVLGDKGKKIINFVKWETIMVRGVGLEMEGHYLGSSGKISLMRRGLW